MSSDKTPSGVNGAVANNRNSISSISSGDRRRVCFPATPPPPSITVCKDLLNKTKTAINFHHRLHHVRRPDQSETKLS